VEEGHLLRLFSAFPDGWPGIGLLLLRTAIGIVALLQAGFYLDNASSSSGIWLSGLVGLAAGTALLIGILTPIAGTVVGLGVMGIGFSILAAPMPNLFDEKLSAVLAATIAAAIVFVGPGAFSVDARLFGRREIIIPPRQRS
jgi:putative oxidoreductase